MSGYDLDLKRHEEIDKLIDKLEREKKAIEERIKMYMGEAETARTDHYVVSWKKYDQERLDSKRLRAEES